MSRCLQPRVGCLRTAFWCPGPVQGWARQIPRDPAESLLHHLLTPHSSNVQRLPWEPQGAKRAPGNRCPSAPLCRVRVTREVAPTAPRRWRGAQADRRGQHAPRRAETGKPAVPVQSQGGLGLADQRRGAHGVAQLWPLEPGFLAGQLWHDSAAGLQAAPI